VKLELQVNGRPATWNAAPGETLLAVLRREGLVAAKRGCETGDCGACTVLLDGQPVNACVVAAFRAQGAAVDTLEGLLGDPLMQRLQRELVDHAAVQCGYCSPGMLVSLYALMQEHRAAGTQPDLHEIREALSGNLCRCTGYVKPLAAAEAVAHGLQALGKESP
jgi:putative selenate reductase molybdopterin-binding subunit